jgi:CheY-like chemotaxis protein
MLMEPRVPAGLEFGLEAYGVELRVLFIESTGYSAGVFRDYVGQGGMEIELARNPLQALRQMKRRFYDTVVIELPTPQIPPDDLFRDIVAIDLEQAVRTIFLVNDLGETAIRRFLTEVGRPFLTQPVDPVELHDLVLRVGLQERAE